MLASQLRHQIIFVIFFKTNQTLVYTDITCQYHGHLHHIHSRNSCLRRCAFIESPQKFMVQRSKITVL